MVDSSRLTVILSGRSVLEEALVIYALASAISRVSLGSKAAIHQLFREL